MTKALIGIFLAVAAMSSARANGPAVHVIACPDTITTTQKLKAQTSDGWQEVGDPAPFGKPGQSDNRHSFGGVSFFSSHPSELVQLVPDNTNSYGQGRRFVQRWTFTDTAGSYVACNYDRTTVTITRPIPPGYKRCEVRYEKKRSIEIVGISCLK